MLLLSYTYLEMEEQFKVWSLEDVHIDVVSALRVKEECVDSEEGTKLIVKEGLFNICS